MLIDIIYNFVGFVGDVVTLSAYFLLQTNKIKSDQLSYAVYNCVGSVFLLISLYHNPNSPAIVIEIAWLTISFYGLYKFFSTRARGCAVRVVNKAN